MNPEPGTVTDRLFVTHQRVTPDAEYLGDPEPGSPEWVALRRAGITGTDVVAIAGESTRDNARTVWHLKRGDAIERPDDDTTEAADWGNELEPVVARVWARRHSVYLGAGGIFANLAHPWRRSQIDRMVITCPDLDIQEQIVCGLEVKTRSAFVAGKWRDDVPDDVLAQVAWQRLVTGLDHIHVACLIGGQRLIEHTYRRDDKLETWLLAAAEAVWENVKTDTPPEIEWDAIMAQLLDTLFPDRAGTREMSDAEFAELMGAWRARQQLEDDAVRAKGYAEAKIKTAMGSGADAVEVLTWSGIPVFTWRMTDRDGYTVPQKSFRTLRGPNR